MELEAELKFNPELLGECLDQNSRGFQCASFVEFLEKRSRKLEKPRRPQQPFCADRNEIKKRVFEHVWRKLQAEYNRQIYHFEQQSNEQKTLQGYEPTLSGYAHFLADTKAFDPRFLGRRYIIPVREEHRRLHTYVTGGTGSGKSEVLKSFIWHYLTRHTGTGLVLLTPHGKIAEEVAQMRPNAENGRLVYICPDLAENRYPCLNPFDLPDKADLSDREAENYAESFRAVFEEILQGVFTEQMNTLLKATLPVIVKFPNASIYDLLDFLDPTGEKAEKYLKFAEKTFSNKNMLDFLRGQFFNDPTYQRTKNAMLTRLQAVFGSTLMQGLMIGKATIDLEKLINEKKLIVFNISKGTAPNDWAVIGKFVIATIKIISFRREQQKNKNFVPCHLFIDECQNYITESLQEILEESRKYRLYLTLAQQTAGAKMSKDLFRSIMGNTGIKITGRNGDTDTLSIMARSTGADLEQLKTVLATGRFSLWTTALTGETQKPPIIVTMPTNTLDNKQAMNAETWLNVQKTQLESFYRVWGIKPPPEPEKPTETQNNPPSGFDLSDYLN